MTNAPNSGFVEDVWLKKLESMENAKKCLQGEIERLADEVLGKHAGTDLKPEVVEALLSSRGSSTHAGSIKKLVLDLLKDLEATDARHQVVEMELRQMNERKVKVAKQGWHIAFVLLSVMIVFMVLLPNPISCLF
ncbi:unnamed protein product [Linum tenue]|uniref:Transmembrane protein n=1 Tax=Linum tenue TaxID=586396 RepID=A0AAV0HNF1_9ROSI|nr:unnamed protein product [Linum tenue]